MATLRRGKNEPEKISEIFSEISKSGLLKLSVDLVPVWEKWRQIVGEEFFPYTELSGFRRGTLYVKVKNTTVMHRLTFEKERIIQSIKEILHKDLVTDLFFELDEDE